MAGGAETAALVGEGQKIFILEIRPEKSVFPFIPSLIDMEKSFKMILHLSVIIFISLEDRNGEIEVWFGQAPVTCYRLLSKQSSNLFCSSNARLFLFHPPQ
jgi:hypothetical protein